MEVTRDEIQGRVSELSDDELLAVGREDPSQFRPETLVFFENEIAKRGLSEEREPPLLEQIVIRMDAKKVKWLKLTVYSLPVILGGMIFLPYFSSSALRVFRESLIPYCSIACGVFLFVVLIRSLPLLDRPLLIISPTTGVTLGSNPRRPLSLSWEQVAEIYPYRTLGKDYLGFVPKRWSNPNDNPLHRFWRGVEKLFSGHTPLRIGEDILPMPIDELAEQVSAFHPVGAKQSMKDRNLAALGIAIPALFFIGALIPIPFGAILFIFPAIGLTFKFLAVLFSSSK